MIFKKRYENTDAGISAIRSISRYSLVHANIPVEHTSILTIKHKDIKPVEVPFTLLLDFLQLRGLQKYLMFLSSKRNKIVLSRNYVKYAQRK